MDRDIIIGMSATFVLWVGAVAWVASLLVIYNWHLYKRWPTLERDVRVKMALWLCIPLASFALLLMRMKALVAMVLEHYASSFGRTIDYVSLPVLLTAFSLALWWAFDRTFGPTRGDHYWCRLMWSGLGLGMTVTLLSWRY